MSDLEKMKIAEAMNYVDQGFVAEYESLSTYIAARKMARRRRMRIASRVAACVAIVGTGAFLTMHDLNAGMKGSEDRGIVDNGNKYSFVMPENSISKGDINIEAPDNYGGSDMEITVGEVAVLCEEVQCDAPVSEIVISVISTDADSLVVKYEFASDSKAKWYTGPGVVITELNSGEQDIFFNHYGDAMDYRMMPGEDNCCLFRYSWADSVGELSPGRYVVTSHIYDGNVTYEVNTTISVKK